MTDRARKLLEDAMTLSEDERLDLAEQLLSSLKSTSADVGGDGITCRRATSCASTTSRVESGRARLVA